MHIKAIARLHDNPGLEAGLRFQPGLKKAEKCIPRPGTHVNSSTRVEEIRRVLCRIFFQKIVRVVGKGLGLVEFFALDSSPPLVNTREISTRVELNPAVM